MASKGRWTAVVCFLAAACEPASSDSGADAVPGVEDAQGSGGGEASVRPRDGAPRDGAPQDGAPRDGAPLDMSLEDADLADLADAPPPDASTDGPVSPPDAAVPCRGDALERCNGLDDDCDDRVDEGFPELNRPCAAGEGVCASGGVFVCGAQGDAVTCEARPGMPAPETCNGLDDDCDGAVDDGPDGPLTEPCFEANAALEGVGVCRAGISSCAGGL
jgi:hypothetical protein